jgi:hypothetical protein
MEASLKALDQADAVDREVTDFALEVEAGLPTGEDLTAAECRADYLLEKLAAETERLGRLKEFSERRIRMIREHQEAEGRRLAGRIRWLQDQIRANLPATAVDFRAIYGAKSASLPHGRVGFRASRATVEITDPAKALAFAKARGLAVKVVESVGKTPLIDYVKRTGEEPDPETDGVQLVPAHEEFFVSPDLPFV